MTWRSLIWTGMYEVSGLNLVVTDTSFCDVRRTLASGHLDNNLRLWDTRTGNGIKELTGIHRGQITSVSVLSGKAFHIDYYADAKRLNLM